MVSLRTHSQEQVEVRTVSLMARKPNVHVRTEKMNMIQKLNRHPRRVSAIHPPAIGPMTVVGSAFTNC